MKIWAGKAIVCAQPRGLFWQPEDMIIENSANDGGLACEISENLWFWAVGAEEFAVNKQRTESLKRGLGFTGIFMVQSNASCSIPATR